MTKQDLEAMEIHEEIKIPCGTVMRVVNGWIYIFRCIQGKALAVCFVSEKLQ